MSLLPPNLRAQMTDYVERGIPPGPFLTALLAGQMRAMFEHLRDDVAVRAQTIDGELPNIMKFRDRFVPIEAHGTAAAVERWIWRGGLKGRSRAEDDWE